MTRPLRLQVADGIYHITARGNERRLIYRDAADRQRFLEILEAALKRFRWRCLSYCLMSNHYHLLVRTPQPNLCRGMRDVNGVYAQWFNRRHGRDGHLFQARYRAVLIDTGEHLLTAVAYIVRNPVRAGICRAPVDWRWSSHASALGARPPGLLALDELLGHLACDRRSARERYRELHLAGVRGSPEIPASHLRPPRPPLARILADSTSYDAIATAYEHGYTMPAIAQYLGLHPSTISRRLARHRAQIKT